MQPDGARIYAPGGPPARGRRDARPAGARASRSSSSRRRARTSALPRLDRGGAARRRGRSRGHARRTWSATRPGWSRPAEVAYAGTRFLTRAGLSGVPETLARLPPLRELDAAGRVHRAARRARRAGRRRPHDEPRHRRRRGQRLRADDEPRARHGRLPPRARPAPEQHARRGRPRPRAARARRADGEHDGAEPRPRRRRARRSRSARPGGTRLRTALVGVAAGILDEGLEPAPRSSGRASTAPATSSTPSRASTSRRSRARGGPACTCGAGRRCTTTSAASA